MISRDENGTKESSRRGTTRVKARFVNFVNSIFSFSFFSFFCLFFIFHWNAVNKFRERKPERKCLRSLRNLHLDDWNGLKIKPTRQHETTTDSVNFVNSVFSSFF
ncbi:hypothetical protein B9Z55_027789 [Caenorhabditis nigoni]|uniref:Transmembrane protein n=1 Tax=Caenorhabditis nigoni TaxID=1611254 RepID=A0A2G5SEB5_9PELO|nr:hypothetical protein B9Z55_027789 [Caenorhabditis nigoni]